MAADLFRPEALQRLRAEPWQPPLLAKRVSGLTLGACALAAVTLLLVFATSFEFARKEHSRGYLAPASGWARVTATGAGIVTRRLVEPGDRVQAGDALLQFGAGEGIAPERTVEQSVLEEMAAQERTLASRLDALEEQFEADAALQRQQTDLDRRTLARVERETKLLRSRLATARKRLHDGQRLAGSGHLPASELLTLADEVSNRALALSDKEQYAEGIRSAIGTAATRLARLAASNERDRTETADQLHDLRMNASRIRGSGFGFVLAPTGGVIASLRVAVGDPLRPGDILLDIVPPDEPLRARLFLRSAAMGALEVGQAVQVYLDAFPHERHGAQVGTVLAIFETPRETGTDGEPMFRVDVGFTEGWTLDADRQRALRPGMTLSADLIAGRATLLDWVLEPLRRVAQRV